MPDESFPRRVRLRTPAEFERIFKRGCVVADECLVVHIARARHEALRLGISIPRKVGNACVRNRWKRVLREVFRRCRAALPPGFDLVIRPRRGAVCDYQQVAQALPRLVARGIRAVDRSAGEAR
jgi:ribonuclease P protein component